MGIDASVRFARNTSLGTTETWNQEMRIKHYAGGKFYPIDCPEGTAIVRQSDRLDRTGAFLPDLVVVRVKGRDIPIPTEPPDLLPMLAESRRFGLKLAGPARPDMYLGGAACPDCGERDLDWLWLDDDAVRCECCGATFPPARRPPHAADRTRPTDGR